VGAGGDTCSGVEKRWEFTTCEEYLQVKTR
jgi:hypothetical protein